MSSLLLLACPSQGRAALCPPSCSSRLQMVTTQPFDLQGGQLSLQEGFPHSGGHQLPDHPGRRPCAYPASRVQVSASSFASLHHKASDSLSLSLSARLHRLLHLRTSNLAVLRHNANESLFLFLGATMSGLLNRDMSGLMFA